MKLLLVVATALLLIGISGLVLASNQQYIPDEEYLAIKEQDKLPPYQSESQQK